MLSFSDLRPLSTDLPKMVVLTNIMRATISRICEGLLSSGVDLKVLCMSKSKHIYAEYNADIMKYTDEVLENNKSIFQKYLVLSKIKLSKYTNQLDGSEPTYFDVQLNADLVSHPYFSNAKLVLMCDAMGLFDWHGAQDTLQNKILLWRLTSCNSFTGYCAYSAGCEKWKNGGCERCPQLGSSTDGSDLAAEIFASKREGCAGLNMALVTPSNWLGQCCRESLLYNLFPQVTIPTCVNLDVYSAQSRENARICLNLPLRRKIILFGAGVASRRNKGFHLLSESLRLLSGQWQGKLPILCFFGQNPSFKCLPSGYDYVDMGYFDDVKKLASAYASADIFVSPSFQDNLPNTVNEALACGTPVVCFDKYSSEDVVLNGVTGYVAEHPGFPLAPDGTLLREPLYSVSPEKLVDLAIKIKKILELPSDEYEIIRSRCQENARKFFSPVLQAARYLQLCRRMLKLPEVNIDGLSE
jgi:hypothetical protein